jgi:predicted HicB family RNase H-like nuclease
MDLNPYLETLRRDLAAAAAPGGTDVTRAAELLAGSLEAAVRLCLLEALSDATAEITTQLDSASVEVRLRGREADLVVTETPEFAAPTPPPPAADTGDLARVTLRLPEPLKEQVERAANVEGVSVNAWLVRAISAALYAGRPPVPPMPPGPPMPPPPPRPHRGRRITGFAQS